MELNLNTVQRPTLTLTLMDEEQTVIRVKMPTLDMFKEMQNAAQTADAVEAGAGTEDGANELYDFLAKVLSCNRDYKTITVEDLRDKYHMELEDVILTFRAYVNFISSVIKAKN